jgi:hypothetical protein
VEGDCVAEEDVNDHVRIGQSVSSEARSMVTLGGRHE